MSSPIFFSSVLPISSNVDDCPSKAVFTPAANVVTLSPTWVDVPAGPTPSSAPTTVGATPASFARSFIGTPSFSNVRSNSGSTSVSYTHLRAHETVLDIVCRLLLEKKNDNKSSKHLTPL